MSKFIDENNEKKALRHAYKKLNVEINREFTNTVRQFGTTSKKILILGKNHAHLLLAVAEQSLDTVDPIDFDSLNLFNLKESDVGIWGLSIYVTPEDDVVKVVINMSSLVDNPRIFVEHAEECVDMEALIADLPDEKKFRKV